ncbi:transcription factor TGAL6 isoform X4 [Zea mays]|uniref:transcription factor TGAL6 isoform X4 n=1 Tax=Zea mays TaxID=4577 RepID=UPI0004DE94D0|nr:uncharacterized protein LOC100192658 isoform X4 [Zea mays]XP_035818761.1 uncharacterized protein LOC100192658 isoform X4 [Zea mays]|eukprot:XP_008661360.1 putative bZIP transcription factor superfamily protein isoform X4 [Zea mays]
MELYPGYLQDHFNIHKLSRLQPLPTSGAPARYVTSGPVGAMGIYERQRHLVPTGVWGEPFRLDADAVAMPLPLAAFPSVTVATPAPLDVVEPEAEEIKLGKRLLQAQQDDVPRMQEAPPSSDSFSHDDDDARPRDKVQRRLAQNREAARKSRLRKKAYIRNLETSRVKLAQLEQELIMARRQQHGAYGVGGGVAPPAAPVDPRVAAFELEYAHWVEEQSRQATELRAALQSHAPDVQLRVLVDAALAHYGALFQAKARAARSDAFFVLSGVWRSPAERFFLWIAGFRPSDLLKVLEPQLSPLMDHQASEVRKLQNTARQLEDALSQGMSKLQQTLVDTLMTVDVSPDGAGGGYAGQQMACAVGKLADLVDFVDKVMTSRSQPLSSKRNQNLWHIGTLNRLLALTDRRRRCWHRRTTSGSRRCGTCTRS